MRAWTQPAEVDASTIRERVLFKSLYEPDADECKVPRRFRNVTYSSTGFWYGFGRNCDDAPGGVGLHAYTQAWDALLLTEADELVGVVTVAPDASTVTLLEHESVARTHAFLLHAVFTLKEFVDGMNRYSSTRDPPWHPPSRVRVSLKQ